MQTVERKWQMIRVAAGDYILPSNDRKTIWRVAKYEDGPSQGLDIPKDREFWGAWMWTGNGTPDIEWDDRWVQYGHSFDTRQEAIDFALVQVRVIDTLHPNVRRRWEAPR